MARGVVLSKVTSQPPKGDERNGDVDTTSSQPPDYDLASNEGSSQDVVAGAINVISPMFYIDLHIGKAIVRALIDSGASANFISETVASE